MGRLPLDFCRSPAAWDQHFAGAPDRRRFGLCENLNVIIRRAAADALAIASILNAFVSTSTIEWTDTPQTADSILEWLNEHEKVLVAEPGAESVRC